MLELAAGRPSGRRIAGLAVRGGVEDGLMLVHVTAHAMERAVERCGGLDRAVMARELAEAIEEGRVRTREPRWLRPGRRTGRRWKEDRARFAWPEDRSRVYVFQRCRIRGRVIVTVLTRRRPDDPWLWATSSDG